MLEKDMENLIAQHPDVFFPNEGFKLISQQYKVSGRRIDILFEDKYNRKIIIEVKRGILTREASGQATEYYGLLKQEYGDSTIELVLVANNIPHERKTFLVNSGIDCREVSYGTLLALAKKVGYPLPQEVPPPPKVVFPERNRVTDSESAAWIFQGNPNIYDIFNALSDENLQTIHWTVNTHSKDIKAGQPGLIWMSGKEAGIYAVTSLLCDPQMMEEFPEEKKYWVDVSKEEKMHCRVRMSVVSRLLNHPIFRKTIKSTEGLENLSILKQAQGTNFPVSATEWKIISGLIYGDNAPPKGKPSTH